MVDIQIDQSALKEVIQRFQSTPEQMEMARASALRKMRTRIETPIKREAAKALRIPQKALKPRFYSSKVKRGDDELKVWIGTQPMSPFQIGNVRPYGKPGKTGGVKAGRRTYRGAFLASIYAGRQKVWIRLSSKHYQPDLYPTSKGGSSSRSERFPVIRAAVVIDEVMEQVVERDGNEILSQFERVFLQELNYYTNVRGKA